MVAHFATDRLEMYAEPLSGALVWSKLASGSCIFGILGRNLKEDTRVIQYELGKAVLVRWHSQNHELMDIVVFRFAAPPKLRSRLYFTGSFIQVPILHYLHSCNCWRP
jgi:hypothetical protein